MVVEVGKIRQQSKRIAGSIWRRIALKDKPIVLLAGLATVFDPAEAVVSLFG